MASTVMWGPALPSDSLLTDTLRLQSHRNCPKHPIPPPFTPANLAAARDNSVLFLISSLQSGRPWVTGTCFGALVVPLGENECPSAKIKGVHQYTLRSRKAKRRAGCKERQKLENSSLPRPGPHHYFITRTSPQNCHLTRPHATLHISDPWRLSLSPPSSLKRETSAQALVSTTHSEGDALNLRN